MLFLDNLQLVYMLILLLFTLISFVLTTVSLASAIHFPSHPYPYLTHRVSSVRALYSLKVSTFDIIESLNIVRNINCLFIFGFVLRLSRCHVRILHLSFFFLNFIGVSFINKTLHAHHRLILLSPFLRWFCCTYLHMPFFIICLECGVHKPHSHRNRLWSKKRPFLILAVVGVVCGACMYDAIDVDSN